MKKFIPLLPILVLFFGCSKNETPTPPTLALKPDTLGIGWSKVEVNDDDFFDIYFINNSVGYLLGYHGIYKSNDGGNTWNKVSNIHGDGQMVVTPDGKVFILFTDRDSLYQSFDQGSNFSGIKIDGTDIYFTDNDTGYIAGGNNRLSRTTNGGISWAPVNPITGLNLSGSLCIPFFINGTIGWISDGQHVFKTNGSINTWSMCNFNSSNNGNVSLYATSANIIYTGSSDLNHAVVHKSIDGGANFNLTGLLDSEQPGYVDIHFTDNITGYVSSNKKIYQTTNGGTTWENIVSLGESRLIEIHFTDANHGWACGSKGTVLIFKK